MVGFCGVVVRFVAEVLKRRRYFASAPELIVMPAALSSTLKVLKLTPRFLALNRLFRSCASRAYAFARFFGCRLLSVLLPRNRYSEVARILSSARHPAMPGELRSLRLPIAGFHQSQCASRLRALANSQDFPQQNLSFTLVRGLASPSKHS